MQSKKQRRRARLLGMDRPITRRDFVSGCAVSTAALASGALLGDWAGAAEHHAAGAARAGSAAQNRAGYYPPRLQGMRGSHPGSFEEAHALRDGAAFAAPLDSGERYDLVVVGGGISGLSAAHFFIEQHGKDAKVLILDNHDDFGGHAKRNEFAIGDHFALLNGGTLMIDSPRPYGPASAGLLQTLGIDVAALAKRIEHLDFYKNRGLHSAVFFDRETFGADHLATGIDARSWEQVLAEAPLTPKAKEQIALIQSGKVDFLPGLTSAEKKDRLSRMSYRAFLTDVVKAEPGVVKFYDSATKGEWAVGIDAVSALDCWGTGVPGFAGMKLEPGSIARMGYTPAGYADTGGSLRLHFPDGNATIARALVRRLVPAAVPAADIDELVNARVDYAQLDLPENVARIRLNSIVVRAQNLGSARAPNGVRVDYRRDGTTVSVRGKQCVLACYNMIVPYLVPELPAAQKEALHSLVKAPLVYTSVALRNWTSFAKLGINHVTCPGCYHTSFGLNPRVDIGRYRSPTEPEEPILLRMQRTPCAPGLPEHEQNRAGRANLLTTSFETFELEIRQQLARILGAGGFDPARDITGIMVNRWPHGYAPEYNPLFDPELPPAQQPHIIARAKFGNIAIANSDSGRAAYTDSAIDQAYRAITELDAV